MISVLVVESFPVSRDYLARLLGAAGFRVAGTAANGVEAMQFLQRTRPDVVTMDLHLPVMNGLEATRRIMETTPVPIVIVCDSLAAPEMESTFRAMEAGALAMVQRPRKDADPARDATVRTFLDTVRLMSEIKVVRRRRPAEKSIARPAAEAGALPDLAGKRIEVVAMGASTGGPAVLRTILELLPGDFPAPLLIVQHLAPGFLPGLVEWLGGASALRLAIGSAGERALPGHAYFAPDGRHMGIGRDGRIHLAAGESENGARPSVAHLFRSVALAYGGNAAAVLLTGMGKDGAKELKSLKDQGAVTIAQSAESSAVNGMPAAAVELGGAVSVLAPEQIAAALTSRTTNSGNGKMKNG